MAGSGSASRAIYAGLSCGFVFAAPVAAYVATAPFSEANSVVTACALPFTVGALAGVGILSAVSAVGSRRAQEDEFEVPQPSGAYRTAAPSAARGDDRAEWFSGGSSKVPKGVPVIARAEGALSEAEAWADLDAILSERSPISCDAAHSKDIYQIAFEELQRGSAATAQRAAGSPFPSTGSTAQQPAVQRGAHGASAPYATGSYAAAPRAAATAATAAPAAYATGSVPAAGVAPDPYSTSAFVASYATGASSAPRTEAASLDTSAFMAQASAGVRAMPSRAAQRTGSVYAAPAASAGPAPTPAPTYAASSLNASTAAPRAGYGAASTSSFDQDEFDTQAAQRAALASLDEIDGARLRPGAPVTTAPAASPAVASMPRTGTRFAPASNKVEQQAGRSTRATGHEAHSGRADIWASALDILMEDEPAAPTSPAAATGTIHAARHMRRADGSEDALRAAAIAEGQRANAMHQHVNSLIEEEFDQVPSSSVRRSSYEYLRVIQGGTAAMPRLQAEA